MSDSLKSLDFRSRKVRRAWWATIVEFVLSPLVIIPSGFNLVSEWVDRKFMADKLKGLDEKASTRDIMQGEGVAIVGIIGGGICSLILTEMLSSDAKPWEKYFLGLIFMAIVASVVLVFKWMRGKVKLAESGSWEPGVPPKIAIKTLEDEWDSQVVRTIWPGTVRNVGTGTLGFGRILRFNIVHVLIRAGFWVLAMVVLFITSNHSIPALLLCGGVLAVSLLGMFVSLKREQLRSQFVMKTNKARYIYLQEMESAVADSTTDVGGNQNELLAEIASNTRALKAVEEKLNRALDSKPYYSL